MKIRPAVLLLGVVAVTLTAGCGDDPPDTTSDSTAPSSAAPTAGSGAGSASTDGEAQSTAVEASAPTTAESSAPPTSVDLADALAGRTFESTSVEGYTLVEGTQIVLTFDATTLGANAGCNQMSGSWSLEGDVLIVPPMAMTQMACDPPTKMDQDTWLSAVLTSGPTVELAGDTLTLAADGATVTLVDQASAASSPRLEGTTWQLESTVSGSAASSVPAGMRTPTLLFEVGTVTVDTGCNRGRGTYQLGASTVTFGPIATTRMACTDPSYSQVEQTILSVLSGGIIWGIDGDVLSLRNGSTGLLLRAANASDAGAALVGPTWTLDSTVSGSTVTAVPAGAGPSTLVFDGTAVAVDTGCNTGSGGYTVSGDQLTFGPMAMTLRLCGEPADSLEMNIVSVLQGTTTYSVDGTTLTISAGDTGLMYIGA